MQGYNYDNEFGSGKAFIDWLECSSDATSLDDCTYSTVPECISGKRAIVYCLGMYVILLRLCIEILTFYLDQYNYLGQKLNKR